MLASLVAFGRGAGNSSQLAVIWKVGGTEFHKVPTKFHREVEWRFARHTLTPVPNAGAKCLSVLLTLQIIAARGDFLMDGP
jgi:hypothetical protein